MSGTTSLTLRVKAFGEKAILLESDDTLEKDWVPHSQIEDSEVDFDAMDKGEEYDFEIKTWILEEKGLI
jgi:hypothetical protein